VILAIFIGAQGAFAQGQSALMEEVVVTATKRQVAIQDVPVSMAAFTSEDIIKLGAVEFADYATAVPNLSFGFAGEGRQTSRQFQVRGIFGTDTSALYINDTPVPVTVDPRVLDVERIEVLRGPQGSLFGSRSMGGLVRLVTKKPSPDEFEGSLHTRIGAVKGGGEDYLVDGSFNIPLMNGKAALRGSAYYVADAGFIDRLVDPDRSIVGGGEPSGDEYTSKEINEDETTGFQLSLGIDATDNIHINPAILYQKFKSDGPAFVDNDINNFQKVRQHDLDETGEDEYYLLSLDLEIELAAGSILSSTTWFNRETQDLEDGTEAVAFLGRSTVPVRTIEAGEQDRITQEARFVSDFSGPFQLVLGAFYQHVDVKGGFPPESIIEPGTGFDVFFGFGGRSFYSLQALRETEEIGIFGEASYDITEQLTLIAGGRWFDIEIASSRKDGGALYDFYGIAEILQSEEFTLSEDGFNPRFGFQWYPNEDMNIYANAAKGYRPGGINTAAATCSALGVTDVPTSYRSDDLWSYELGAKTSWAERRVELNVAAFYMDWSDFRSPTINCGLGFGASENTGKAESKGFELDLVVTPAAGLTLSVGLGYTDAEITNAGEATSIVKGDPLPNIPEWTGVAAIDHDFELSNFDVFWRIDYRYVDSSISRNGLHRPSYELVNLRGGLRWNNLEASVFLENVTNEHANLADPTELSDGLDLLAVNRPFTAGVDLRYRF